MNKHPFMRYAQRYMDSMIGVYAEISWNSVMRRFRRMERDLMALKEKNVISTASPKRMTAEDVKQHLIYRKSTGAGHSDIRHEISSMRGLFAFLENPAAEMCMSKNPQLKPKGRRGRLPSMPDDIYKKILVRSEEIDSDDRDMIRAYALVLLTLRAGNRNKEVRLANMEDLDTENWLFHIIHTKGEGTYGHPRTIPIHPEVRPIIKRYLALREKILNENSKASKALFPTWTGKNEHLSSNSLRVIKSRVEKDINERFDLRMCRRTFGQQYKDAGADIETISVMMGHASTKTTEEYYCRLSERDAINNIREIWEK